MIHPISEGEDATAQSAIEQRSDWKRESGVQVLCNGCFARLLSFRPRFVPAAIQERAARIAKQNSSHKGKSA